jgi:hypothetical protein
MTRFSRGAAHSSRNFKMMCERPPRSLRSRLPLTRGRAAEGGKGSLTRHLEFESGKTLIEDVADIQSKHKSSGRLTWQTLRVE